MKNWSKKSEALFLLVFLEAMAENGEVRERVCDGFGLSWKLGEKSKG